MVSPELPAMTEFMVVFQPFVAMADGLSRNLIPGNSKRLFMLTLAPARKAVCSSLTSMAPQSSSHEMHWEE